MKPIAKLIRQVQIQKLPTVPTADAALLEYTALTNFPKEVWTQMEQTEESNSDGWEAWIELKEWLMKKESEK